MEIMLVLFLCNYTTNECAFQPIPEAPVTYIECKEGLPSYSTGMFDVKEGWTIVKMVCVEGV